MGLRLYEVLLWGWTTYYKTKYSFRNIASAMLGIDMSVIPT